MVVGLHLGGAYQANQNPPAMVIYQTVRMVAPNTVRQVIRYADGQAAAHTYRCAEGKADSLIWWLRRIHEQAGPTNLHVQLSFPVILEGLEHAR